jgi:hypothetical protein
VDSPNGRSSGCSGAGAPIDAFGVGTKLAVSRDAPDLDMAYKLVEYAGKLRLELSSSKATYPGRKQVFRSYHQGRMDEDGLTCSSTRERSISPTSARELLPHQGAAACAREAGRRKAARARLVGLGRDDAAADGPTLLADPFHRIVASRYECTNSSTLHTVTLLLHYPGSWARCPRSACSWASPSATRRPEWTTGCRAGCVASCSATMRTPICDDEEVTARRYPPLTMEASVLRDALEIMQDAIVHVSER